MEKEKKLLEKYEKINGISLALLFLVVALIEIVLTIALFRNGEIFRGKERLVIIITASVAFLDLATVIISGIVIKILERKLEI